MDRIKRRRAVAGVLTTVALAVLAAPVGAHASGGYTLNCQGTSPVPVVPSSSVTCVRPGKPSDDDGAYTFTYNPPLRCGATGPFTVMATGPEMQIGQASGSYITSGTTIVLVFSYTALDLGVPPAVETHTVNLQIDCTSGATFGTLSE